MTDHQPSVRVDTDRPQPTGRFGRLINDGLSQVRHGRTQEWCVMLIRTWALNTITVIDVHGRLGVESGGALHEAVHVLINDGRREVVLDLRGVTGVDAAGLGELASALSLVRANGGELRLVVRSVTIRDLLVRTKLIGLLPTFHTEAEAIASLEVASRVTRSA
jgi:anti-sigma B factor antagonist